MKRDIHPEVLQVAEDMGALDHHLSPQSLERFLQDDRVWPVEVWMKLRGPEGEERLALAQLHPDPCSPGPGKGPLEREWMLRVVNMDRRYVHTIRECPERIIAGCPMEGANGPLHEWSWERDNGMPAGYLKSIR